MFSVGGQSRGDRRTYLRGSYQNYLQRGVYRDLRGDYLTFAPSELVKTDLNASVPHHRALYVEPKEEKKEEKTRHPRDKIKKKAYLPYGNRLAYRKLVVHTHGMTNFDMLNTQLEEAQLYRICHREGSP